MDLQKFIQRQRVTLTAIIGILSQRQSVFVDKMSELVLRQSSESSASSSEDDELSDFRQENMEFARKMLTSKNQIDKRLINLYKIHKVHQKFDGSGVAVLAASEAVNQKM